MVALVSFYGSLVRAIGKTLLDDWHNQNNFWFKVEIVKKRLASGIPNLHREEFSLVTRVKPVLLVTTCYIELQLLY